MSFSAVDRSSTCDLVRYIRNPRSHEQTSDTKQTADAIIVILDYLLGVLSASQQAFTPGTFVARVLDPEFVDSARYAELLIEEIPSLKRGDALIALYHQRREVNLRKLRHLIRGLLGKLGDNQLISYTAQGHKLSSFQPQKSST